MIYVKTSDMKIKSFLIAFPLLLSFVAISCTQSSKNSEKLEHIDSLLQINNRRLEYIDQDLSLKNRFRIYKTENLYNVLELDSKTGQIYQVQWSLDTDEEFTTTFNYVDLRTNESNYGSNSFELYPTGNMYQFILLDKTNGRTWHVQWGLDDAHRWIRPIK